MTGPLVLSSNVDNSWRENRGADCRCGTPRGGRRRRVRDERDVAAIIGGRDRGRPPTRAGAVSALWPCTPAVLLAAFVVTLALGVPRGTAGNCVDDAYCFVHPADSDNWNSRHVFVDDDWREAVTDAESSSIVQRIDDRYRLNTLRQAIAAAGVERSADDTGTLVARRFEWREFAIGMVAAVGSLLALVILGASIFGFRLSRGRTPAGSGT